MQKKLREEVSEIIALQKEDKVSEKKEVRRSEIIALQKKEKLEKKLRVSESLHYRRRLEKK